MKQSTKQLVLMIAVLSAALVIAGCKKKEVPPPPPPPPPPAPTASLSANPDSIEQGQSTTLTWQTSNATDVSIDNGVGAVQPNGSQQVSPGESTTYTLTAKGPGGSQSATARVTVTAKPAPPPPPVAGPTDEELFNQNVKDIFFDYDKYDIRADQESPLQGDVAFFKEHPGIKFVIEGHCDERGSTEYNLTLGDNRANAAKNALIQAGVSASQIVNVISYGKEKPFCTEHTEECWQLNRRAHLVYQK